MQIAGQYEVDEAECQITSISSRQLDEEGFLGGNMAVRDVIA